VVVLCAVGESRDVVMWVCWCGVGDEGRPSLCLFYIRCLLVGDQVDDVVPRWAPVPFTTVLGLTVLELRLGCVLFVVSSRVSRLVLFPLGLLCVFLDATVCIVRSSGADPARVSLRI
jgi:hypothetical protein